MPRLTYSPFLSKLAATIVIVLMAEIQTHAQELPTKAPQQNVVNPVDLIDVIRKIFNKNGAPREGEPKQGVPNLSILPILGYGPANGFVIGSAVSVTELLGNPKTTQLSSALLSVSLTTKNQVMICARSDLYLANNKWYLPGDFRLLLFAQPTYGLGIYGLNSPVTFNWNGMDVSSSFSEQPMRFNYTRIYETAVREIFPHWYAGLGINIDFHNKIEDEVLKLDTPNPAFTAHYLYSKKYGFNPERYSTNGLSLQIIEDSRDNPVSSYRGTYFKLSFRINETIFGSSQNSNSLFYEWRNYIGLQKDKPGHVLAFWTWGDFVTGGKVPYLALPSITWDTYGRSGRGYIQGRFRGTSMVYGETEYRLPISKSGLFGVAAFVNATTASNPTTSQPLFATIAPGYGFGIRINMNKKDRTNICVDYGRGLGSSGVYFNIRETF